MVLRNGRAGFSLWTIKNNRRQRKQKDQLFQAKDLGKKISAVYTLEETGPEKESNFSRSPCYFMADPNSLFFPLHHATSCVMAKTCFPSSPPLPSQVYLFCLNLEFRFSVSVWPLLDVVAESVETVN